MILSYENKKSDLIVECKKPTHFPPHIHEAIEIRRWAGIISYGKR